MDSFLYEKIRRYESLNPFHQILLMFSLVQLCALHTLLRSISEQLVGGVKQKKQHCLLQIRFSSFIFFQPCLEHQYIPKVVLPIALSTQMLSPFLPNRQRVEVALLLQSFFIKQALCPLPQWSAQPTVNRNTKAHLGPLDQCFGHMPV